MDSLLEELYEHWIDPELAFARHQTEDGLGYFSSVAQDVMQVLAMRGGSTQQVRLLDFGMGWGRWAAMARAFGCEVAGTELSASRIAHAKKLGIPVVSWDSIPQSNYDVIQAEQVLEHVPEPRALLQHLATGLRPGGMLKIGVPPGHAVPARLARGNWSLPYQHRLSLNPVAPLEHINCFTWKCLRRLGCSVGLLPMTMPMLAQWRHTTGWSGCRRTIKNLVQPIWRNVLHRHNWHVFVKPQ